MTDRRLLRHLVVAILLKLVVLTALWWALVRDERVSVDSGRAAVRIATPSAGAAK